MFIYLSWGVKESCAFLHSYVSWFKLHPLRWNVQFWLEFLVPLFSAVCFSFAFCAVRWTPTGEADKPCNSSPPLGTVGKVFPVGVGEQSHCVVKVCGSTFLAQPAVLWDCVHGVYFGLLCFLQAVCWTLLSAGSPSKRKAELGGSSLWLDVCLGLPHGVWELSTGALCREGQCGLCWVCSLLWFDPSTPQQELVMDPVWLQCRQNHGLEWQHILGIAPLWIADRGSGREHMVFLKYV